MRATVILTRRAIDRRRERRPTVADVSQGGFAMFDGLRQMIRNYRGPGDARYGDARYGDAKFRDAKYGEETFKQYGGEEQRELVRRAQAGDTAARDELITSYVPAIAAAICRRCKRRPDEFDDCAQEVMFRLMRAAACYNSSRGTAVSTYFFNTIFRTISKFNRSRAKQGVRTISLSDSPAPAVFDAVDDEAPFVRAAQPGEKEQFAAELLSRASPRERQVLTSVFRGESLTAIGKRIGVTCERVRQIKETGLDRIRRSMAGRERRPR
jgi:RNA polymerase sigma factor (sigma-70 family)